jgi:hypothetical protein
MTSRKIIDAGNAIGFGGKPGKPPTKLKREPRRGAQPGQPAPWNDLFNQWESTL